VQLGLQFGGEPKYPGLQLHVIFPLTKLHELRGPQIWQGPGLAVVALTLPSVAIFEGLGEIVVVVAPSGFILLHI
jgi:hypothetical protein